MSLRRRLDLLHALSDSLASSSRPYSEREAAEHLIAARNAAVWEDVWVQPERSVSG